jgi:flagellar basal-body rod protein FlgB
MAARRQAVAAAAAPDRIVCLRKRQRITHLAVIGRLAAAWHTPCSCTPSGISHEDGMALNLDSYLGVHAQALTLEAKRTELLASNMANADTPNYKARDIDFKAAMAAAGGGNNSFSTSGGTLAVASTHAAHLPAAGVDSAAAGLGANLKYRVPMAPSLDGNTVDTQLEQAAFAENSVRYQATLTFLNARLKELMTAIVGQ